MSPLPQDPLRTPVFIQIGGPDAVETRRQASGGLLEPQAQCSPKFLYDSLGSRLFEAITELPEYYPTRTEASIFERHSAQMAAVLPQGCTLIDLGAGNCAKAASLFGLCSPQGYVAVDISVDFLSQALQCLQRQHPGLAMWGLGADFSDGLELPDVILAAAQGPRLLFYPGSSIGNFTPAQAVAFLKSVHQACGPHRGSGLLIGVDLVKDAATLQAAYDDPLGVTAAFNLNLLLHLNRVLQADFRLADWRHLAFYNDTESRIEMHLQARHPITVCWRDEGGGVLRRSFAAGQTLHTENSYKWTPEKFADLLRSAGFGRHQHWSDPQSRFAIYFAEAG